MKYCIKKKTGAYFQAFNSEHMEQFGPLVQAAIYATLKTAKNVIHEYKLNDCFVVEKEEIGNTD